MDIYILLDRSGSMAARWEEALSAINSYVADLAKSEEKAQVSLAAFDRYTGGFNFDVLRDRKKAKKWKPVGSDEASPRGMTPLLDAVGRIVTMAEEAKPEKAVLVIMTDGAENCSHEVSLESAKASLDRCRAKNWQVVFLGADFDAFGEASALGIRASGTLNTTAGNYGMAAQSLSAATRAYASTGRDIKWSEEDRRKAAGK